MERSEPVRYSRSAIYKVREVGSMHVNDMLYMSDANTKCVQVMEDKL